MKKFMSFIIAIIISISMFLPVCAANIEKSGDTARKSVLGKYQYSSEQTVYVSDMHNGSYAVCTDEGLQIVVSPKDNTDLTLVVRTIQKTDNAFVWFEHCFAGYNGRIIPLDIFYVNEIGERIELKGDERITVTFAENVTNVYFLSTEENIEEVESQKESNAVSFNTFKSRGYYVLFIKENNQQTDITEEPNNNGTSNETPKTNDMNITYISFIGFVFFAILSIVAIYMYAKNKKNDKKSKR